MREEGLVFDARGAGALALGAGRHLGARLAARWTLARHWALFATASVVRSRLAAADNPLLADASALVATSYRRGATMRRTASCSPTAPCGWPPRGASGIWSSPMVFRSAAASGSIWDCGRSPIPAMWRVPDGAWKAA